MRTANDRTNHMQVRYMNDREGEEGMVAIIERANI